MKLTIFAFLLIGVIGFATAANFAEMFNPMKWLPIWMTDTADSGTGAPAVSGVGGAGVTNGGAGAATPTGGAAAPAAAKPASPSAAKPAPAAARPASM